MDIACQSFCPYLCLMGRMLGLLWRLDMDIDSRDESEIKDISCRASNQTERTDIKQAITGSFEIRFID